MVLLVPRAGADGKDIYEKGPYVKLLPTTGPGYDVCWASSLRSWLPAWLIRSNDDS